MKQFEFQKVAVFPIFQQMEQFEFQNIAFFIIPLEKDLEMKQHIIIFSEQIN